MRIFFITDGGGHLGLGHIQQSLAFAQELLPHAHIFFITKSNETVLVKIREKGFEVTWHENDIDILKHLTAQKPDVIIFDKLDVAEELARGIKQTLSAQLVIFTNLTNANRYADIAVTADIGSQFENIRFIDEETSTLYFYGPRYWVLRPEFYQYQRQGKDVIVLPKRVLLIFGGSDPTNLTSVTLEQILQIKRPINIDVVLGADFHHDKDMLQVLQRYVKPETNLSVYRNVPNIAELMYGADLVLASPGLSAFEALRVGTPVIVIPHDTLQRDTYQGFLRVLERDKLTDLKEMIENGDYTSPKDDKIIRMEIGEGIQELKEEIICQPTRSRRCIG